MSGGLPAEAPSTGLPASEEPRDGLLLRLARADEYPAIDRLVAEAYAHDYGPSDESGDPMRLSEVRAREHEVWVAIDAEPEAAAPRAAEPGTIDAGSTTGDGAGSGAAAGELLGTVTLRVPGGPPLHQDFREDVLDLRLLAVSPRARRRGLGEALMHVAERRAREGGFSTVALKTAPNMRGAHRLYEALGYSRAPEWDGLWIDGKKVFDLYAYLYRL